MNGICGYVYYKVKIECKGSAYISTDWEGDSKYEDYSFEDEHILQGCELMEMFAKELNDIDCMDFRVEDNKYMFGFFNPNNGSGCDKVYVVEFYGNKGEDKSE